MNKLAQNTRDSKCKLDSTPLPSHRIVDNFEIECLKVLDSSLHIGLSILDENLNYLYINKQLYEQLNVSETALGAGDNLKKCHELMIDNGLLSPQKMEQEELSSKFQELRRGSEGFSSTINLFDGRTMQLQRCRLENGYTLSISHDISELVEKDKLLQDALRLGRSGYWIYDLSSRKMLFSTSLIEHLEEYLGVEGFEHIENYGFDNFVIPEDRHILKQAISLAIREGEAFDISVRMLGEQEDMMYVRMIGEVLRNADNQPAKIRSFVKDITQSKHQAMQLERARNEAIEASNAKSEFLANVSHEIRTPMNGILGMAELLAHSDIEEGYRNVAQVIYRSSEALLGIINDLLDFSKIEAGAMEIDLVTFDLIDVLSNIDSLFSHTAQQKGVKFITHYPENSPQYFVGDVGRIRQILNNLVGNAIKFTSEGSIELCVALHDFRSDLKVLKVDVKDTGIGIEAHKLKDIFEKFTQADNSTTRVYGGTGLGLSISKKLVEMMGGRISAKSTIDEGSTFSFALPLRVATAPQNQVEHKCKFRGKRILFVDIMDTTREALKKYMQGLGLDVSVATDFKDAEKLARQAKDNDKAFDVCVISVPDDDEFDEAGTGPDMNILTSMTRIAEQVKRPIILMTSQNYGLDLEELSRLDIHAILPKPINLDYLKRQLEAVIPRGKPTSSNRELPSKPTKKPRIEQPKSEKLTSDISMSEEQDADMSGSTDFMNILVAEDLALNREVVGLMLADTKYKPVFAQNGQIALDLYKKNPDQFSLIFLDVSMPVMDGYQAAHKIVEYENKQGLPHTPILALTGHLISTEDKKSTAYVMDDYLRKPIKRKRLMELIEAWLAKEGRASNAV